MSQEHKRTPAAGIEDLESNEGVLDDTEIDVARVCSICLEELGT
jgi:hypothetical protein